MQGWTNLVAFVVPVALAACGSVQDNPTVDAPTGTVDGPGSVDAPGGGCGDGVRTAPEECDDGNTMDGDGCSATCRRDPAGSLTFYLTGRVTVFQDPGGVYNGTINVGTQFTGRYTYNPQTPDSNADTTVGDYQHTQPGFGIFIEMGGNTFRTNPMNVDYLYEIVHRNPGAMVMHSRRNLTAPNVTGVGNISWQLDGKGNSSPFSSDAILTQCPDLLAFDQPFGLTMDGNIGNTMWFIRGVVETCMQ